MNLKLRSYYKNSFLLKWIKLLSLSFLLLFSCALPDPNASQAITWLTENRKVWKIQSAFQNGTEINPSLTEEFQIIFFERGGTPSFYEIEPAQTSRPDYNTLSGKRGKWSTNRIQDPNIIIFSPSLGFDCEVSLTNLTAQSFTLQWQLPKSDDGKNPGANKLEPVFKYNFVATK